MGKSKLALSCFDFNSTPQNKALGHAVFVRAASLLCSEHW